MLGAYISYNKAWENEVDYIVFKKDKVQYLKINQLKLQVHNTYKKDETITTSFEPVKYSNIINKGCLDEELFKLNGQLALFEKDYSEFTYKTTNNL